MNYEIEDAIRGNPMSASQIAESLGVTPDEFLEGQASPYAQLCTQIAGLVSKGKIKIAIDRSDVPEDRLLTRDMYKYYLAEEDRELEAKGLLGASYTVFSFDSVAHMADEMGFTGDGLPSDTKKIFRKLKGRG